MPRNNDVYSAPPGTGGTPQTPISSAMFNAYVADITTDLNTARPVVAGGTGQTTASLPDTWTVHDPVDSTKKARIDAGSVTAGQTRVLASPDFSGTLHVPKIGTAIDDDDVDGSNILTLPTDGNTFAFTGTQQVDSIATYGVGQTVRFVHGSERTFTHNATDLICPGAVNLITQSGDISDWQEYAAGDWRCVNYLRGASSPGGQRIVSQGVGTGSTSQVTGVPPWATEFKVGLDNISTNGNGLVLVQIGTSSGIETSGYLGGVGSVLTSTAANGFNTTGVQLPSASAGSARYGVLTFQLVSTNRWSISGIIFDTGGNVVGMVSSVKTLSGPLDRFRLITTDNFDSGSLYIIW